MSGLFNDGELEAIAKALGSTTGGLTGSEIDRLLAQSDMPNPAAGSTKWRRLLEAFRESQRFLKSNAAVIMFIRRSMDPIRYTSDRMRFETMREEVNTALALCGLALRDNGELKEVTAAQTLSEATQRARDLRSTLSERGVHADVLAFCKTELVVDNYFHAVLEAVKSISKKIQVRSGHTEDGSNLFDAVFGGDNPIFVINPFKSASERMEQKGFVLLMKGVHGMFRNPTAHDPKITWPVTKEDAEDLLATVSLIHRRLDTATVY